MARVSVRSATRTLKEKHSLLVESEDCALLFSTRGNLAGRFHVAPSSLCVTPLVRISPGPGGDSLGAGCDPPPPPLLPLAGWLQLAGWWRRRQRRTGPACQDARQAVGCRLDPGGRCVLYLFILSAGREPDPPRPAAGAVGRDGGRTLGGGKACWKTSTKKKREERERMGRAFDSFFFGYTCA